MSVGGLAPADDAWSDVVGQEAAAAMLRSAAAGDAAHAWLFVGPHGSGKRQAARAFAGDLLAREHEERGDLEEASRARMLARTEAHPDLIVVERVGASISKDQAVGIVTRASRSAVEGSVKVMVLDEFHLLAADVAPRLLKTIEEPPPGTHFIVLADEVPNDLVTIASRCVRVEFSALTTDQIADRLRLEGVPDVRVAEVAPFAAGDLDRARLLATDDRLALRLAAWRGLPARLDGSGHAAAAAVDDLRAAIDDAEAPLRARHVVEVAELEQRIERYGQRGSGAKALEERHKRETRRLRTDELRMGLAALAGAYRDEMVVAADPMPMVAAIEAIGETAERLGRNTNEELQLITLALSLPSLS